MAEILLPAAPSLAHLLRLTDDVGIIQHATFDIPNRHTGYCTDDVARACIVSFDTYADNPELATRLQTIYLGFLHFAQMPNGRFHNFMSYSRQWLDETGDDDAIGRAIWALGYGERHAPTPHRRAFCARLINEAIAGGINLPALHSMCYAALGLSRSYLSRGCDDQSLQNLLRHTGNVLLNALQQESREGWHWFEHHFTYDSARLSEALIAIGIALDNPSLINEGVSSLEFYVHTVFEAGMLVPIGSNGWYCRDSKRAYHPQQPIEAAATIDALSLAFSLKKKEEYREYAECAYAWFHGKNTAEQSLVYETGCADGIDEASINKNMGAESTISYLSATYGIRNFGRPF